MTLIRRRLLELFVSVTLLHALAIGLYYAIDIPHAAPRTQRVYGWLWMGLTVLVVLVGLQRLKRARRSARRT